MEEGTSTRWIPLCSFNDVLNFFLGNWGYCDGDCVGGGCLTSEGGEGTCLQPHLCIGVDLDYLQVNPAEILVPPNSWARQNYSLNFHIAFNKPKKRIGGIWVFKPKWNLHSWRPFCWQSHCHHDQENVCGEDGTRVCCEPHLANERVNLAPSRQPVGPPVTAAEDDLIEALFRNTLQSLGS